ncbi:MAG: CBS domain-containing protein [Chloroflexi bacterium]|jgi:CBS domain-containing protein/anti-sigma regulatory factor (Ser/Thr protein kinase)|nr:CBS domain-containing protein [Chloroflexota bacterium]
MAETKPIITDEYAESITRAEELAYELRIREVMTKDVYCINPDTEMETALDTFQKRRFSGAPVTCDGELIGIISIEDLIRALRKNNLNAKVREYMTTSPTTVNEYDPVVEALKTFSRTHFGRLPVLNEDQQLVGILTKGDISNGLLNALQRDYHKEELIRYRASHLFEDIVSGRTSLILRYEIRKGDFIHGGNASSKIKRALLRLGATPQLARRCGIAVYEAEMNLIIHTNHGGTLRIEIEPHRITMEAYDDGPGIEDIDMAMQTGYSTATHEIREMGFGAGMGLVNIKRCVDEMRLISSKERGTNLFMIMYLNNTT